MNWRGRPLTSHQVIVDLIGATTTTTGLTVHCVLDTDQYPTGIKYTAKARRRPADHPPRLPRRVELHRRADTPEDYLDYFFARPKGQAIGYGLSVTVWPADSSAAMASVYRSVFTEDVVGVIGRHCEDRDACGGQGLSDRAEDTRQ